MGRAQFEYDEVGNTFYYVLVSFYAVVLLPLTHLLWPSAVKRESTAHIGCQCEGDVAKRARKDAVKPWEVRKRVAKALVLLLLWAVFAALAFKVSTIEHTHEEYDPYKILGLDQGADAAEVRKKYRDLTKIYHPDRGGNATEFDDIAKAYQALTNEESRENWEKYGNPDGPKATTFGIALPKWLVSERYGLWVLAFYGLIFMVILPLAVGTWWYKSMKYSADKVLLETTRLFYHFLQKTPSMETPRTLMVLSGSFEFWRKFNAEIVERESDNYEVPLLMKELRNVGENKKEPPFHHPYSIKARILLHAYLSRIEIGSPRLESDQQYMLDRILPLLDEYVRVLLQMMLQIPMQRPPTLETLENVLRLYPMFVQALWPRDSQLLQLPHLSESNIGYLRKNRVITCNDLATLPETKRRSLLNTVNESEYTDIMTVLGMMPRLEVSARLEVEGEDDKDTITVGSVVTLKVLLKRTSLYDPNPVDTKTEAATPVAANTPVAAAAKPSSASQPAASAKRKPKAAPPPPSKLVPQTNLGDAEQSEEEDTANVNKSDVETDDDASSSDAHDDSDDEGSIAAGARKDALLDNEPTNHHEVHCPNYPCEKHEWWYLYLVEKKSRQLASMVIPCKTLDTEKEIELRFSAPPQKGIYYFHLYVRSDSYMECDYTQDVKMEVHPAREPVQIKYMDTEDEEEGENEHASESSSYDEYTENSDSD